MDTEGQKTLHEGRLAVLLNNPPPQNLPGEKTGSSSKKESVVAFRVRSRLLAQLCAESASMYVMIVPRRV